MLPHFGHVWWPGELSLLLLEYCVTSFWAFMMTRWAFSPIRQTIAWPHCVHVWWPGELSLLLDYCMTSLCALMMTRWATSIRLLYYFIVGIYAYQVFVSYTQKLQIQKLLWQEQKLLPNVSKPLMSHQVSKHFTEVISPVVKVWLLTSMFLQYEDTIRVHQVSSGTQLSGQSTCMESNGSLVWFLTYEIASHSHQTGFVWSVLFL